MKAGCLRRIVALCGFLLFCGTANADVAQDNTETYKLAKQLVDMQVDESAKKKTDDMYVQMFTPLVMRDNPGQQAAVDRIMQQSIRPVIDAGFDDTTRQTAEIYAQNFSADELRAIIAFQSSPIGVKYRKFSIEAMQKIRDNARVTGASKAQEAVHALVAQLKSNNLNVPKELDH